jgi:hypothetical protein
MPGQGLTGVGGVIFVGARVGWWIDFPVEAGIDLRAKKRSWNLDIFEKSKRSRSLI